MKEFLKIILSFNIKNIFYRPTENLLLQFFRYGFVGAAATIADWGALFILTEYIGIYYLISGVSAFLLGLSVNFFLSKKFVFSNEKNEHSPSTEFAVYGIIGVIGLLMTMGIMFVLTEKLCFNYMMSKIISTVIVFVWNFAARKIVLYR